MTEYIKLLKTGGLQCDNPDCDWKDESISMDNYGEWLNAPCPKCGENVLTERDYQNVKTVQRTITMINGMNEEEIKDLTDIFPLDSNGDIGSDVSGKVAFEVQTHNEIKINQVSIPNMIEKSD